MSLVSPCVRVVSLPDANAVCRVSDVASVHTFGPGQKIGSPTPSDMERALANRTPRSSSRPYGRDEPGDDVCCSAPVLCGFVVSSEENGTAHGRRSSRTSFSPSPLDRHSHAVRDRRSSRPRTEGARRGSPSRVLSPSSRLPYPRLRLTTFSTMFSQIPFWLRRGQKKKEPLASFSRHSSLKLTSPRWTLSLYAGVHKVCCSRLQMSVIHICIPLRDIMCTSTCIATR